VRRRIVIVPVLLLAGVLLARRNRRRHAATAPLPRPSRAAPAAEIEPASRFVSVPWTLVEASATAPRLTIRCHGDAHMELDRVDAQETPTQVFVTVLMHWRPPAAGSFAAVREDETDVVLSSPLGTRELVHAPVDLERADEAPAGGEPSDPPLYP
jgi:hypothetical protein